MANYVRCIVFSNIEKKGVIFTEDMDKLTKEFIPKNYTFDDESEFHINDLPAYFPFEKILWAEKYDSINTKK